MSLEDVALDVLDVLIGAGGTWTAPEGQVLTTLAQEVVDDGRVGEPGYKRVSMAVLYLEHAELVTVERRDVPESRKANVILSISVV